MYTHWGSKIMNGHKIHMDLNDTYIINQSIGLHICNKVVCESCSRLAKV